MKLLKFNLIFIPLLALCLGAIGYVARELLLENARQQVIQNARIIMETALSSRTYTTKQVAPLLQQKNFKLQSAIAELQKTLEELPKTVDAEAAKDVRSNVRRGFLLAQQRAIEAQQRLIDSMKDKPGELLDTEFHPQSVPAFAATEIFGYLREKFPDYFYKEATLNPTNPRNRSTDWETDVVNQFRAEKTAEPGIYQHARDTGWHIAFSRAANPNQQHQLFAVSQHAGQSASGNDQTLRDGEWIRMEDG